MSLFNTLYEGGQLDEAVGAAYVPTLNSAPTANTITYTRVIDGTNETIAFVVGQFARVAKQGGGYDIWQLYDLVTENNVTTAVWRSLDNVVGEIDAVLDAILGSSTLQYEKSVVIETPVNATDATLPITTLTCEVGKYYRIDVPVNTLAVTLPAMSDNTTIKAVVLYLTADTTPSVTISSTAVSGGTAPDVVYQDGFKIEAGSTYEINCLWNGSAWVLAGVEIVVPEAEEEGGGE